MIRPRSQNLFATAILGVAIAGSSEPLAIPSQQQSRDLSTLSELAPRTEDEVALAHYFRREGKAIESLIGTDLAVLSVPERSEPPGSGSKERATRAERILCGADVLFLGSVSSLRTMLNEKATWLITEYTVATGSTIAPVDLSPTVRLGQLGGRVEIAGQVVSTSELPLLQMGHYYLFTASRIPGSQVLALNTREEIGGLGDKRTVERLAELRKIRSSCSVLRQTK